MVGGDGNDDDGLLRDNAVGLEVVVVVVMVTFWGEDAVFSPMVFRRQNWSQSRLAPR